MSDSIWDRFPQASDIRCVEMKDQLQGRVSRETRNASADELVAYFHDASWRFWQEMGRPYPLGSEEATGEEAPPIQK
ncbi:MAG: hypothetical protein RBS80_19365 [Thermoguttaceae bacterium]|jgi:hypothetical protein|nr:hypothetical protein [Thermoguttaceae bacterium]